MTENDIRVTVQSLYDAYQRGEAERFAAMIHDDIDWIIYAPIEIFPFAGQRRGREAVLRALAELGETYELESHQREIVVVDGDRAAVMADVSFRQRATGRKLRFRVANFLRFKEGRLVEFSEFSNSFDVVEQALGRELSL